MQLSLILENQRKRLIPGNIIFGRIQSQLLGVSQPAPCFNPNERRYPPRNIFLHDPPCPYDHLDTSRNHQFLKIIILETIVLFLFSSVFTLSKNNYKKSYFLFDKNNEVKYFCFFIRLKNYLKIKKKTVQVCHIFFFFIDS